MCGILVVIMGCVACIEERGDLTNLGFGIPAGLSTVIAAGNLFISFSAEIISQCCKNDRIVYFMPKLSSA